ncbi:hypothetical protein P12x_004508 [Tundrisphaera lichenicola]|uniref:hypothetical protein n=1 Tax=Tundrisphaera lichenicola TaxID=2029860 RepID=UPI003EBED104
MIEAPARTIGHFRWNIKRIMILVAILGVLFGVFGVAEGIGIGIALMILLGPPALARPDRRWEAFSWVAAALPTLLGLSLLATWWTAWAFLGHQPRLMLDDPKFISVWVDIPFSTTLVFIVASLPSALVCLSLAIFRALGSLDRDSKPAIRIGKALLHPALWIAGYAFLSQLGDLVVWYMD